MNNISLYRSTVDSAFLILIEGLSPYVNAVMTEEKGNDWTYYLVLQDKKPGHFSYNKTYNKNDLLTLLKVITIKDLAGVWRKNGWNNSDIYIARRLKDRRNELAHFIPKNVNNNTILDILLKVERLLGLSGAKHLIKDIEQLKIALEEGSNQYIDKYEEIIEDDDQDFDVDSISESDEKDSGTFSDILNDNDYVMELLEDVAKKMAKTRPEHDRTWKTVAVFLYLLNDYVKKQLRFNYEEKDIMLVVRFLWTYLYSEVIISNQIPDLDNGIDRDKFCREDEDMLAAYYAQALEDLISKYTNDQATYDMLKSRGII